MWQECWNSSRIKLCEIKRSVSPWPFPLQVPRKMEVISTRLTQIITHEFLMTKRDPSIRSSRGTQHFVKHIITECRTYTENGINSKLLKNIAESLRHNPSSLAVTDNFIKEAEH